MPRIKKLSTYVTNLGSMGRSAAQSAPCGTLSSRTMIVIRIAITPSLNASRRVVLIRRREVRRAGRGPARASASGPGVDLALRLRQECADVERARDQPELAALRARPLRARQIAVELDPVAVGI